MSVNPQEIIRRVELGTSALDDRIRALNEMCGAGYPVGLLIAPVILLQNWKRLYGELIDHLADTLSPAVKQTGFIEIILMTYSYVQIVINAEAFQGADILFDRALMTGRGRGKYCYRQECRNEAEDFLRDRLSKSLSGMRILYIS